MNVHSSVLGDGKVLISGVQLHIAVKNAHLANMISVPESNLSIISFFTSIDEHAFEGFRISCVLL